MEIWTFKFHRNTNREKVTEHCVAYVQDCLHFYDI